MSRPELIDSHGRLIDYIRISLTDRCNFRCVYCMPKDGEDYIPHTEILSYEELLRLCALTAGLGIRKYKITGGEPFCRKGSVDFMRSLKALPGVEETTVTTNGVLLDGYLEQLAAIGVKGINVSLDSLEQGDFSRMTRSDTSVALILAALARAKSMGMRVKINTVPIRNYNEKNLVALARYALEQGYHIRFIELMPVGQGQGLEGVPLPEVKAMMEGAFGPMVPVARRMGNGPAVCYHTAEGRASIGYIGALSEKFCHSCNRIRLTSAGYLKTCLHHHVGVDLKKLLRSGASDAQLGDAIVQAVARKPKAHSFVGASCDDSVEKNGMQPEGEAPTLFFMHSVGG